MLIARRVLQIVSREAYASMDVKSLDQIRMFLRDAPVPEQSIQNAFVLTNPRIRSHGEVGDCTVLALSIVQGWNYCETGRLLDPFFVRSEGGSRGILGGDLTRLLKPFGFHPVKFLFPITLSELWNAGFFEIQKLARRTALICTRSGRGAHTMAFIHGRFYGDYLPEREDVRCVFLKPANV